MTDRNILSEADRRTGMTVPDGFFEQFNERMVAMLPEQPWEAEAEKSEPHVLKRNMWQRVRPYVYMAAMFAGIWLMMNMSSFFAPGVGNNVSPSSKLAPLASLLTDKTDSYVADYALNNFDDADIFDDLYASGFDPASIN